MVLRNPREICAEKGSDPAFKPVNTFTKKQNLAGLLLLLRKEWCTYKTCTVYSSLSLYSTKI